MMRRTKFPPYQYQKLQRCICEDCKQEVYDWWLDTLKELSNRDRELANQILNELPFPMPRDAERRLRHPYRFRDKEKKSRKGFFNPH